jgi:hypothetical protein
MVQSQRFWVGEVRWFPFPIDPSLPDEVFGSYGFSPKAGSKHTTHLDASKVAKTRSSPTWRPGHYTHGCRATMSWARRSVVAAVWYALLKPFHAAPIFQAVHMYNMYM